MSARLEHVRERGTVDPARPDGGTRAELDLALCCGRRLTSRGSVLRTRPVEEKIALTREFARHVVPLVERGALRPVIDRCFPLERAAEAHAWMEADRELRQDRAHAGRSSVSRGAERTSPPRCARAGFRRRARARRRPRAADDLAHRRSGGAAGDAARPRRPRARRPLGRGRGDALARARQRLEPARARRGRARPRAARAQGARRACGCDDAPDTPAPGRRFPRWRDQAARARPGRPRVRRRDSRHDRRRGRHERRLARARDRQRRSRASRSLDADGAVRVHATARPARSATGGSAFRGRPRRRARGHARARARRAASRSRSGSSATRRRARPTSRPSFPPAAPCS